MKTRNAFALRDFDDERILQRPWFRKLNLPDADDEEILALYDVSEMTHLNSAQIITRREELRGVLACVAVHTKRIMQHERRISDYAETDKPLAFEAFKLAQCYRRFMSILMDLQGQIRSRLRDIEKAIDSARRKEFSVRLRAARKAAGLKRLDVSSSLGCSLNKVASYEQAATEPSLPTLIRLCELFNVTTDELLGFKN